MRIAVGVEPAAAVVFELPATSLRLQIVFTIVATGAVTRVRTRVVAATSAPRALRRLPTRKRQRTGAAAFAGAAPVMRTAAKIT